MKSVKALSAIVLACVLALGLFACGMEEEEAKPQVEKTPLAVAQSDPLAYLNTLIGMVPGAEGFVMETGYGMDDIEAGNDALKAAKDTIKGFVIDYIKGSKTYSKKDAPEGLAALYPALFSALTAEDLPEGLVVSDVLTLRVNERLANLEKDIEEGRNTSMKGKTDEEKLQYVKDQMGESEVRNANAMYQIEGKLSLAAAETLLAPADKADILAQLAKAKDYLLVEDYALEPAEFTLFATVNKAFIDADKAADQVKDPALAEDQIRELTLTLKSNLTATAQGTGGMAEAGSIPITLKLTKTVKYKDIKWEAEENA